MGYYVRFDALDDFNGAIKDDYNAWSEQLNQVANSIKALASSTAMSGQTADNIKNYLQMVHVPTLISLLELTYLHLSNCLIYKTEYQSSVDGNLHAVIDEQELTDDNAFLTARKDEVVGIDTELLTLVADIKDIVEISFTNAEGVAADYDLAIGILTKLDEKIQDLEDRHFNSDFTETSTMIDSLKRFIQEQSGKDRSYKTDFTADALTSDSSYTELAEAYVAVNKGNQENAAAVTTAIENENTRVAALAQEEYEKREKIAKAVKIYTAVTVTVAAVVVSAVTFGAATGAAAVGAAAAIGAISCAITGLVNSSMDQYTVHGYDLGAYDWGAVAVETLVSTAAGGLGGAAGGAVSWGLGNVSNYALSQITSSAVVQGASNTTQTAVNIGTKVVFAGSKEVFSGMASRGTETLIRTGDIGEAWDSASDLKEIGLDATLGVAGESIDLYRNNKNIQAELDRITTAQNTDHQSVTRAQNGSFADVGASGNQGVDYSNSSAIRRDANGDILEFKVKFNGDKDAAVKQAEKLALQRDPTLDFNAMKSNSQDGSMWHVMDDYNVATGEATVQFVKSENYNSYTQVGAKGQYNMAKKMNDFKNYKDLEAGDLGLGRNYMLSEEAKFALRTKELGSKSLGGLSDINSRQTVGGVPSMQELMGVG